MSLHFSQRSSSAKQRSFRLSRLRAPVCWIVVLFYFLPIYWMIKTSIQPDNQITITEVNLGLTAVTVQHYFRILLDPQFGRWFLNSTIYAVSTMFIAVLVSTLAAYSLARQRFWFAQAMGRPFLAAYIVPGVMIVVPIFVMMAGLGWQNTYQSLIITYTSFSVPFCTWLLRAYFRSLPAELEDAALVDGCSRLGALFRIIFPLAAPGVVTAGLFCFILAWNEYLFAFVFLFSNDMKTLTVALQSVLANQLAASGASLGYYSFGEMFAMTVLTALPIVVVFLLLQNWLVKGLAAGAVKG
ncbi:MAG TPA: carbohydrate ABC transporter permease [Chloroflexota bacterium]|nr:carbohydrate ABC transporter permease [Chloroflexota bacterium]